MKFFNGLIIGVILGAASYWFLQTKAREHPEAEQRFQESSAQGEAAVTNATGHFSDALRAKLDALDLRTDQIKDELARTGKIIRRKASTFGQEVADAASDTRITAAIKAKYTVDHDLSVWQISVSCTQGHVTLSGSVDTPEDIGKAVALALEVDGVTDVISTMTVKNTAA